MRVTGTYMHLCKKIVTPGWYGRTQLQLLAEELSCVVQIKLYLSHRHATVTDITYNVRRMYVIGEGRLL